MRFRTLNPWDPSLADWTRLGGHTCSGVVWEGEALPGLQLLVPRTDKASAATAGPEAWEPGEPRAQSLGSPHRGSVTAAADAGGAIEEKSRGTAGSPRPPSSHESPYLPLSTCPRDPSHRPPFGLLPM